MSAAPVLGPIGSLIDHAVAYAEAGFEVFPVNPQTKTPIGSQYNATTDVTVIELAWERHPTALIGCRVPVGYVLTDIDPRHGGAETWRALQDAYGKRPETRIHQSGRGDGGGHLWWAAALEGDELFTTKALDRWAQEHGTGHEIKVKDTVRWSCGVDLLQHNHRYTILPPSPHPETGKPYRWVNDANAPIAELPGWLRSLVVERRAPVAPAVQTQARTSFSGDESIIDWFNRTTTIAGLLAGEGWTLHKGGGDDDGSEWRHPTADRHHTHSASVKGGLLYVYSPNTVFEVTSERDPHGYDAFDIWCMFNHQGDRSRGAKAAMELRDGPRTYASVTSLLADPQPAPEAQVLAAFTAQQVMLPESFWSARPVFDHIRRAAHSRARSGDLVLMAVLARLCAYSSHTIKIPPISGSAGSLNLFVTGIGGSGAGKSSGVAVAAELVPRPPSLEVADDMPLGTGEGLAELFMGTEDDTDEKGKKIKVRRQVRFNAFVYGDEGAALNAMAERSGATLPEALRRAWSGAALGQANASADRTRVIGAGFYRLALVVCFQPELAAKLLADADAGTPQRFLWCSAHDPNIPDHDKLPDWPGPLEMRTLGPTDLKPYEVRARGQHHHEVTVTEAISTEIRRVAVERGRGTSAAEHLDSHEPLHLLKTASALAMLDGRLDLNDEDWALAKTIYATSKAVRASVELAVAQHQHRDKEARIAYQAEREIAVEGARRSVPQQVERLAKRIAKWLHGQDEIPEKGWPARDLRSRLSGAEKHLFDAAVGTAISEGWVVENDGRFALGASRPAS